MYKNSYLLFYLKAVLGLGYAQYALLSGQIADAIATPIVGYLSDRTNTRFGKRKPWYIAGFILVIFTFLPTFHRFLPEQFNYEKFHKADAFKAAWYCTFPAIFNIGWASVQISHMSLVP